VHPRAGGLRDRDQPPERVEHAGVEVTGGQCHDLGARVGRERGFERRFRHAPMVVRRDRTDRTLTDADERLDFEDLGSGFFGRAVTLQKSTRRS